MILLVLSCVAFLVTSSLAYFWIKTKYADARAIDLLTKQLSESETKTQTLIAGQDAKLASVIKQLQDEVGAMNRRISATETLRSTVRNPLSVNRPG